MNKLLKVIFFLFLDDDMNKFGILFIIKKNYRKVVYVGENFHKNILLYSFRFVKRDAKMIAVYRECVFMGIQRFDCLNE